MSVRVDLAGLEQELASRPATAYLVTVNDDGTPRATSVGVTYRDGAFSCGAGRHTRANATARPAVTLLWPAPDDEAFALLVDGTAAVDDAGETVVVTPTAAVQHRQATANGPSCIPLDSRHD